MRNLILERPTDIKQLNSVLDKLVTYGGVRLSKPWQIYLRSVGVAYTANDGEWIWPTQHFLMDALPAANATDLARRAILRDPLYRMHLDLALISVVHSVAIAERWGRLEEILFNFCRPVAPRLMQLLDWQMARTAQSACTLSITDWNQADEEITGEFADTFLLWDRYLWGECRRVAELFPLLLELYIPLCNQPIHFFYNNDKLGESVSARLAWIIKAAREGEGLILPTDELEHLMMLQNYGIPIRTWNINEKNLSACLVGNVSCESEENEIRGELRQVPSGLSAFAKQSYLLQDKNSQPPTQWSTLGVSTRTTIALYSIPIDSTQWPTVSSENCPDWLMLPGADVLATAGKRRSDSPDADQALSQIANHPLYGIMLQLLLLEALDRELGEETLVLALPQNRKLESFEDWADTKVLYRPRDEETDTKIRLGGFLVLGTIDEIMSKIGHEIGICVVTPYTLKSGLWSRSLALMNTAGLVDGRPGRWTLTITSFILDRFHSGSLMKDIIRGGRTVRNKMHEVLTALWQEQSKIGMKAGSPA